MLCGVGGEVDDVDARLQRRFDRRRIQPTDLRIQNQAAEKARSIWIQPVENMATADRGSGVILQSHRRHPGVMSRPGQVKSVLCPGHNIGRTMDMEIDCTGQNRFFGFGFHFPVSGHRY